MVGTTSGPRMSPREALFLGIATLIATSPEIVVDASSSCQCITVHSWSAILATVATAETVAPATGPRPHILLCPFNITKHEVRDDSLVFSSSIHLQCYKENPSDECVVWNGGGARCGNNPCEETIMIQSNDVWLQGFSIRDAQIGAMNIGKEMTGIKLIDMEFHGNSSPEGDAGSIVFADVLSRTEVFESLFVENRGTALQNYGGNMIVVGSQFIDNTSSEHWMSNDVEIEGGGVGGAIINSEGGILLLSKNKFIGNEADSKAPAVWSFDQSGIDLGENSGLNNQITGTDLECNGIYYMNSRTCAHFSGNS